MNDKKARIFLSILFTLSLSKSAFAVDEILVTGYTCPYGATCLTGDNMYWYAMTHYGSYPSYPNYYYGSGYTSEEQKKKKEEEIRQCKANAGGTAYSCKNAYANLGKICNTYTGALGGWATKFITDLKGTVSAVVGASGGLASADMLKSLNIDSTTPCDRLAPIYEPFCEKLGKDLAAKCI